MRPRSQSGVRLDQLMVLVQKTILKYQDPITGLFTNNPDDFPTHAWIRDNVYAVQAIWAMFRAYQKRAQFDEDLVKARELALNCVKVMQSLLECMLRQADKVELFKRHQRTSDSLHSKYSAKNKSTVVGDNDWGHLQIDAISLYLLLLAQMTASGLQIVRNFDEVAFVQNLVYYIETGYRTPDFGVWERGDKTNQGIRELNASSIGMAKAALQALNDVGDLFGDGSKGSVIHVLPDEIQQCSAVLCNMLPCESFSKETDAGLLAVISYPAFAVDDLDLLNQTRDTILATLGGRYGCKRFLRDGYKTAMEDPNRLHYINSELQKFENIECEWPVFLCYLCLDAMYRQDEKSIITFWKQLQDVLVPYNREPKLNFVQCMPELYRVPQDKVEKERLKHGSQDRVPGGTIPFMWAQSLYVLCALIHDRFLTPAELDPLSRRLSTIEKRPHCEVQVVIIAENIDVKEELAQHDINVETITELDPKYAVLPASILARILQRIGQSQKLRLSGRPPDRDVQLLSTSRLYHVGNKLVAFIPQFMDVRRSHLIYDIRILMDEWSSELYYIYSSWNSVSISGRPLVVLAITSNMIQADTVMPHSFITSSTQKSQRSTVLGALKKIKNGYIAGARVVMGNISDFSSTTSISKLQFHDGTLEELFAGDGMALPRSLPQESSHEPGTPGKLQRSDSIKGRWFKQFTQVHETSMRHRSIVLDSNDADLLRLRLAFAKQSAARRVAEPTIEESHSHTHLQTSYPENIEKEHNGDTRIQHSQLEGMQVDDLVTMLAETTQLDEQASIVHFLWLKLGPNFDTKLANITGVTVKLLVEEIYTKACECRDWAWVRLMAGLLGKQLDELDKAVTHLLVRQKQITVGMPSKNEEAITCPKNREELRQIFNRCYDPREDPSSFILAQELIVSLGSLVRTEPKLFVEMFRLRIGLIIQVLASELSRLRNLKAAEASDQLLSISPFELKCMLLSLLSGRLLEESGMDSETGIKEMRTGIGSFRKQIEERKSMRKVRSMRDRVKSTDSTDGRIPARVSTQHALSADDSPSDSEELIAEEFQFGVWLRHRRIDGALNRVPPEFYANLWDTLRMFPHGLSIDGIILGYGLTQEMTRKEIKFALQVEQVLNQIAEPEYRELIVEVLTLMGKLKTLIMTEPRIPHRHFEIEYIVQHANRLFVDHNMEMYTIVLECCGSGYPCDSARGICKHFYDTAPAGEYGTAHYIIRSIFDIFA